MEPVTAGKWNGLPEFLDLNGAKHVSSLGRSYLYKLISDGAIRSVCLRSEGRIRGKRLIQTSSLLNFLRRQPDDVTPEMRLHAQRMGKKSHAAKRQKANGMT